MREAFACAVLVSAIGTILSACSGGAEKPRPTPVQPVVVRQVHPLLRGTIGAEGVIAGAEPELVGGLGLVVGLNGTGGDLLPEEIAATMERQMGLMGVGREGALRGTALEGKSPSQVLRDPNVAVVEVLAAIPPGLPVGSTFDVYVRAINATSLEGGTLWTTDLRLGPPTTFGRMQTRLVAKARGPVFINPFSEKGRETEGVTQRIGRVLAGGEVTNPLDLLLILDTTSHARTRAVVSAINSRFPQGPGDRVPIARGRNVSESGGSIALHVPRRYRDEPDAFIQLVLHLPIDSNFPEQWARRLADGLRAEPALADEVSWCFEAAGKRALPIIRELYDYPELAPRMAALKAGARLNDAIAAAPLRETAKAASGSVRSVAISLLGQLDAGPTVDVALWDLLKEPALSIRVAAYEALARRATRAHAQRLAAALEASGQQSRISPTRLEVLSQARWPRDNFQGLERRQIGSKFHLDLVPFGDPLIYVTQQGQPRIVLFGSDRSISRPTLVSAWGDRLLIIAEPGSETIKIRYARDAAAGAASAELPADLATLIEYLAHKPGPEDPRPGLDLSYSDVVGVLSALAQAGGTRAPFATEQDRLKAVLASAAISQEVVERPEKPGDEPIIIHPGVVLDPEKPRPAESPRIVPIEAPPKK
jgi:hypothetical protein